MHIRFDGILDSHKYSILSVFVVSFNLLVPSASSDSSLKIASADRLHCDLYENIILYLFLCGPASSSGKVLNYGLDGLGSILGVGGVEIFLHSFVSRLVKGSIQPPIKYVLGAFPGGKDGQSL